ncbi:MAG: catalase family peroxidase [Alphaproteobacteria bacterium]|nr:catalase family peroxidase [Alphaproteobacteria bacterium]
MPTDLGTELVDALEAIFGVHPGARRAHAKGRLYDGRFTPTPSAARLSRAPQFGAVTPLIVRCSDGTGLPEIPDNDPAAAPPGFAIRFLAAGGAQNDIVANADEGFAVRNGEDFVAFLRAVAGSGAGVAAPTPLDLFVAEHLETQRFLARPRPTPRSFATTRYFGNNALVFVAPDGARRAFRYVIEPEAGIASLTPEEAKARQPRFLFDDLDTRLAAGPVRFTLVAQLAGPGDPTNDVTILWPADRERVTLGTIELSGPHPDQEEERRLFFDPNNLPDGIALSDDPLLAARRQAYGVSIARRTGR